MKSSGIEVIGSLNPNKKVQDRVRVLSRGGYCQSLRATDYKDPPKIVDYDGNNCFRKSETRK